MKSNLKYLLAFAMSVSQICATPALANSPALVSAPGVSSFELQTYSEAMGRQTFSERLNSERPSPEAALKLKRTLEKAQKLWLSDDSKSARATFLHLTQLAFESDWQESQRKAIHYGFLRLAESAETTSEQNSWLVKAVAFDFDLSPDPDLFPPPLIANFEEVRTQVRLKSIELEAGLLFPHDRFLLVNGKSYELKPDLRVRIPLHLHRITLFSDSQTSFSGRMQATDLQQFKSASRTPLAGGNCQTPSFDSLLRDQTSEVEVFYSSECVRSTKSKPDQLTRELTRLSTQPEMSEGLRSITPPSALEGSGESTLKSKRTWLWVGLGILACGAGYLTYRELNKSASTEPTIQPTSRNGF